MLGWRLGESPRSQVGSWLASSFVLLVLLVRLQWNSMLPVLLSRLLCHSIVERLTLAGCRFCRLLIVLVMCLVLLCIVLWRHTFILCADVVDVVVLRVLDV